MKRAWLRLISSTLNPVTRRIAASEHGPFSLVRHVGRKTGTVRETPIVAAPIPGGFMIELTYGRGVQWWRNVQAAGEFELVRHRIEHHITGWQYVDAEHGRAAFPLPARVVLRALRRRDFVQLTEAA
ncbi:nitroreductase family deazaflavin-dependent oxidoreductase [Nocardioides sp. Kera G14]|uniref:nitroreductase family deazaflavin-dependent oxidoreductase n=1 Tax=Nocardioides sp. Kera G14 TaxID=2884264 RepID=UPI001D0FE606|nr:nitroreductase family deazaflavin-dependent oxidoreductase [Nocardioides sp. Kera G14]UDY23737.1 nitroreductase family deazaflavin-dependent oxidoreductase [Nocardioides sp. Kera G14]